MHDGVMKNCYTLKQCSDDQLYVIYLVADRENREQSHVLEKI